MSALPQSSRISTPPSIPAGRFLLLIVSCVFSFLAVELLVRLLHLAPELGSLHKGRFQLSEDRLIAYEPRPNVDYRDQSLDFYQYRGRSNELGFRGPVYAKERNPAVHRVIVIGDSSTEGMGIDRYEDVWTAVLERSLNENGTASEVMNFGVSGYNAQQKVQTLLRKALQFNPELVIFQYTLTDGKDPYFYLLLPLLEAARRTSNSARTPIADALSLRVLRIGGHSALVRALLGLWIKYRPSAPAEMQNEFAFERYKTGDTRRSASGQFAELARRHGFNPAALIFPVFPPHHTSADYPFWPAHGEARAIFDEQQIPVLDLYDVLIECRERHQRPVHQELFHANELGNRCVGEAVALWVRELLDQPDSGLRAKPLLSLRQARAPNDS